MPNYQHNERILEREARSYWNEERIQAMRKHLLKKIEKKDEKSNESVRSDRGNRVR
jgi:hypothetical protein